MTNKTDKDIRKEITIVDNLTNKRVATLEENLKEKARARKNLKEMGVTHSEWVDEKCEKGFTVLMDGKLQRIKMLKPINDANYESKDALNVKEVSE